MRSALAALILVMVWGWMPILPARAAGAAMLSLTPTSMSVEAGERFDVTILANPNGEQIDTVRAFVEFSPGILRAEYTSLGEMFPRTAPGDTIDNASGDVSFGGFTLSGPVTDAGTFGTITFKATRAGTATITLLSTSRMISGGEEKYDGASRTASVTVTEEAPREEGAVEVSVVSSTHPAPESWYKETEATFSWQLQEGETVTQYLFGFDDKPDSDPTQYLSPNTSEKTITDIEDGVWYFHLKGKRTDGTFTDTVHQKVQVDATIPNPIAPTLSLIQFEEDESTELSFGTTDETSGILGYQVSLNQNPYFDAASPLTIDGMRAGTYLVEVKAIDLAGNEVFGSTSMRVYPTGTLPEREAAASQEATEEEAEAETESNAKMLITYGLVLAAILAIIYAVKRRKRRP
jgi:hypothetical protein